VNVEIIAIGSELLTPFRQDTNSLYLTGKLNELGAEVNFKTIVGDTRQHLVQAAGIALDHGSGRLGRADRDGDDLPGDPHAAAGNCCRTAQHCMNRVITRAVSAGRELRVRSHQKAQ